MTPAVKFLETHNIAFDLHHYEHDSRAESYGLEAAAKLNVDALHIYKTLMVALSDGGFAIGVIPVEKQLVMKKIATAASTKKASMAKPNDVHRNTGYILGGVSPVGQTRAWPTFIDNSAEHLGLLFVSAGKRGLEIALTPQDLALACNATFASLATQ